MTVQTILRTDSHLRYGFETWADHDPLTDAEARQVVDDVQTVGWLLDTIEEPRSRTTVIFHPAPTQEVTE